MVFVSFKYLNIINWQEKRKS